MEPVITPRRVRSEKNACGVQTELCRRAARARKLLCAATSPPGGNVEAGCSVCVDVGSLGGYGDRGRVGEISGEPFSVGIVSGQWIVYRAVANQQRTSDC